MEEIKNAADLIAEARRKDIPKERLQELVSLSDELAEAVAQNIAAPPGLLGKLARHDSKAVRKAVTSNPQTPEKALFYLGVFFPQELLDNPIFDFSLLKNLSFIRKIPSGVLSILVQQNNVPRFLLNYAVNHPAKNVSDTAKMHVDISGEMKQGWHELVKQIVQENSFVNHFIDNFHGIIWDFTRKASLRGNYAIPRRSFRLLTNFYDFIQPKGLFKSLISKRSIAKNLKTTPTVLKKLAFDEDYYVRGDVSENPNTPAEVLILLSKDSNSQVRNGVAGNPNTPAEILKSFTTDSDIEIRYRLAGNPSTPGEILKLLISNYNNSILRAVARNPSTPVEVIKLLANDSEDWFGQYVANNFNRYSDYSRSDVVSREYNRIIKNIAKNPSTPIELLSLLANDADYWMRRYISENPNAPGKILKSFADFEDRDNGVYSLVAKHPNTPREVLESFISISKDPWGRSYDDGVRESVADNPNAPSEILEFLAKEQNIRIRFRVARNSNTPIDLLESLANDSNHEVREAVAKNSNTSLEILEKLANDCNLIVRESVAENPNCTLEIKKTIFKNFAKSETPSFSRVALFLSDYAASFVLTENSNSISWLERYAIAQNQNTLRDTLEVLAQDSNQIVRATAKESLAKLSKKY